MSYLSKHPNWHQITNTEAYQLTACTVSPELVFSYAISALPTSLQKMPGLYEAYASGYRTTYRDIRDMNVQGEFIAARSDDGIGKLTSISLE